MNQFAKNLKYLLDKTGVKQSELALQVNKRQTAISSWKNGESQPSIENILVISDFFGIAVGDLLSKDLSNVHLNEKIDKEKIGENVHPNVHGNVHPKAKNYPENDIKHQVAEDVDFPKSVQGSMRISTRVSPPDEDLFWRDKYIKLLEKTVDEKPNSSAPSETLEDLMPLLRGMHRFLLELAADAHHTTIESEAMRLNNIVAEQLGISQKKDTLVDTHK